MRGKAVGLPLWCESTAFLVKQQIKPIDACRLDLFTGEEELREKYDMRIVVRILRIREEYNWFLSNPDAKDRQFVETVMSRHGINKTQAYSDLAIIKALLPMMSQPRLPACAA